MLTRYAINESQIMLYREWILPSVIDREIWQILHHINHMYKTNWKLWNKGGRKLPHQPPHPHPPTTFWQIFKKKLNCQHGSKNCQINQNAFFFAWQFWKLDLSTTTPFFKTLRFSPKTCASPFTLTCPFLRLWNVSFLWRF